MRVGPLRATKHVRQNTWSHLIVLLSSHISIMAWQGAMNDWARNLRPLRPVSSLNIFHLDKNWSTSKHTLTGASHPPSSRTYFPSPHVAHSPTLGCTPSPHRTEKPSPAQTTRFRYNMTRQRPYQTHIYRPNATYSGRGCIPMAELGIFQHFRSRSSPNPHLENRGRGGGISWHRDGDREPPLFRYPVQDVQVQSANRS